MGRIRSVDSSILLATTTCAATIFLGYHYLVIKKRPSKKAKFTCAWGQVQGQIEIPAANYSYIPTTCLQCQCNDCVHYVEKVLYDMMLKFGADAVTGTRIGQQ